MLWRGGEYVEGVKKQHGGGGRKMEVNKGERTAGTKQVFFILAGNFFALCECCWCVGPLFACFGIIAVVHGAQKITSRCCFGMPKSGIRAGVHAPSCVHVNVRGRKHVGVCDV